MYENPTWCEFGSWYGWPPISSIWNPNGNITAAKQNSTTEMKWIENYAMSKFNWNSKIDLIQMRIGADEDEHSSKWVESIHSLTELLAIWWIVQFSSTYLLWNQPIWRMVWHPDPNCWTPIEWWPLLCKCSPQRCISMQATIRAVILVWSIDMADCITSCMSTLGPIASHLSPNEKRENRLNKHFSRGNSDRH